MSKIVIIGQWTFPANTPRAFRSWELAKEFARQGHEVIQYAMLGDFDYADLKLKYGVTVKNLGHSFLGMSSSNSSIRGKLSFSKRVCLRLGGDLNNYLGCEIFPMVRRALKNEENIDLLITIAFPHAIHWATSFFIDRKKVKCWIADCGDPFMGNPFLMHPFYGRWLEKHWCKIADFIAVPIENGKNAYYPEFREKIRVIPQGFNFDDVQLEHYSKNQIPTFCYAGQIYKGRRDPFALIEYIKRNKLNVRFVVYSNHPEFKKLANKYPFLEIHQKISRQELIKELSTKDFLINILNPSVVQSPSKLIDYSLAKRPILNISIDFTSEEIRYFNEFMSGNYTHQYIVPNLDNFRIQSVYKQFVALSKI